MKTKTWILILAALLAICCVLSVALLLPGNDAARAEIWSGGKLLYTLDLHLDQQLTVTTDHGSNTITIRDGAIAVTEANCPDGYCMSRGFCKSGPQIVCLPHRLVIRFTQAAELDGITS